MLATPQLVRLNKVLTDCGILTILPFSKIFPHCRKVLRKDEAWMVAYPAKVEVLRSRDRSVKR